VTFVDPQQPRPVHRPVGVRLSAAQIRELVALTLVVLGALGVGISATLWHPLAGLAVFSIELIAAGLVLGLDR
jgi:hypothetical protein